MEHIMAFTVWHQAYPDYAERFAVMANAARLWMQSTDCALSLVPR